MAVLVTGGAGYIGSHTCISLIEAGYTPVILDNFVNSSPKAVERVEEITGKKIKLYKGDIADKELLHKIFNENDVECVIHFAGLKAVGESVSKPLLYYTNNVSGTLIMLNVMNEHNVKNIIFSSSATIYGDPESVPITEDSKTGECTNPYGFSKYFQEQMLMDLYKGDNEWNIVVLRYFNPVGAHKSGLIGEDPNGIPNNLMPYISKVSVGKLEKLHVFGNDYDTPDGTGVRDYIHVCDLADGHVKAIKKIEDKSGLTIYNLGTGKGSSVLDMVNAFKEATGVEIPYVIDPRRPGDIAECFASVVKAKNELGFEAKYNILDMCKDAYNWQSKNPNGYN